MTKVRRITQLELEGFAATLGEAEEASEGSVLSFAEVRARELAARLALTDKLEVKDKLEGVEREIPGWAELYHRLINAQVPWKIAAFIAWSTMPKKYRWPDNQEALATEVLGLTSDRRIAEWRRKYPYIDQMIADFQAEAMLEYVPGAIHALGTVASDTSYRANPDRRLLFEITKLLDTRQKIEVTPGGGVGKDLLSLLEKVPTAQLAEMLGEEALELLEELREEGDDGGRLAVDGGPTPDPSPNSSTNLERGEEEV